MAWEVEYTDQFGEWWDDLAEEEELLVLLPFVPRVLVWPLLLVIGLCATGWSGMFFAAVAESAGTRGVARASTSAFLANYLGSISLPPLFGVIVSGASWRWLWLAAALSAALAGATLVRPARAARVTTP